jgi:hypothetical protein
MRFLHIAPKARPLLPPDVLHTHRSYTEISCSFRRILAETLGFLQLQVQIYSRSQVFGGGSLSGLRQAPTGSMAPSALSPIAGNRSSYFRDHESARRLPFREYSEYRVVSTVDGEYSNRILLRRGLGEGSPEGPCRSISRAQKWLQYDLYSGSGVVGVVVR